VAAEVTEARGARVVFRVIEAAGIAALPVRITLIAAIVKFDRFEWMIEKATELGVERILPMEAARTEKGLFEAARKRAERWRRIARESSQQARRVSVPEILPAARFEALPGGAGRLSLFSGRVRRAAFSQRAAGAPDRRG
jgi:16S rRNA (uracil1498-N3)-methyltransferase